MQAKRVIITHLTVNLPLYFANTSSPVSLATLMTSMPGATFPASVIAAPKRLHSETEGEETDEVNKRQRTDNSLSLLSSA